MYPQLPLTGALRVDPTEVISKLILGQLDPALENSFVVVLRFP